MPYTLVTVVTPSEPTGDPRGANPFGRQLPGPFAGLRGIGSHLARLSEPRGRPLLVLFAVFDYAIKAIIGFPSGSVNLASPGRADWVNSRFVAIGPVITGSVG